jgi:hypothetical protein
MARPSDVSHDRARSVQHVLVKQLWARLKTSPGRQLELDLSEVKVSARPQVGITSRCRAEEERCTIAAVLELNLELNNDTSGSHGFSNPQVVAVVLLPQSASPV